jgi:endoglycosylceramidase
MSRLHQWPCRRGARGARGRGAALLLALAACGDGPDAPTPIAPSGWHVAGGSLRAEDGRAVTLRGVNLANAHKEAPYFGFHRPEDFTRIREDWALDSVRLLTGWAAIEPAPDEYDEAYLDALGERLDWAEAAGLAVVLDMHQDLYGEGFGGDGAPRWSCDESHYAAYEPISPWFLNYLDEHVTACIDGFWQSDDLRDHYRRAWLRLAERFADHPAVVGFDPMNEPYWGSMLLTAFEPTTLQPFYEQLVMAVRERAPGWVAFLEPAAGANLSLPRFAPFAVPNVVLAPHSYDRDAEAGKGFDPSRRESITERLVVLRQIADELGTGLWIGEYGGRADDPGIEPYLDAQYDGAGEAAAGTAYWSFDRDGGYGLLDADGHEKPALLTQVVRPYPELVAGEPVSYRFDEASRRFELGYRPDPRLSAPTEIVVPERVYPDGVIVSCGGCEHRVLSGRVLIDTPPPGAPATVTLLPP